MITAHPIYEKRNFGMAEATVSAVAGLEADYEANEYAEDRPAEPLVASPGGGNALHHP